MRKIVVGVLDTPASRSALRWAFRTASHERAELEVVTAYALPALAVTPEAVGDVSAEVAAREQVTLDEQERILDEELGESIRDVPISRQVLRGDPAPVLIDRSAGAAMLVVGRKRRRFRRLARSTSRT
jgi:nucleotide-binding universal stress UspA family protein